MGPVQKQIRLSREELKELRFGIRSMGIVLLIFLLLFGTIFIFAKEDEVFRYFLLAFIVIGGGMIVYVYRKIFMTVLGGYKTVIRGVVTDLEKGEDPRNASSNEPANFIHIGEHIISVNNEHYEAVKEGDLVELHYLPRLEMSLSITILDDSMRKDFHFPM